MQENIIKVIVTDDQKYKNFINANNNSNNITS